MCEIVIVDPDRTNNKGIHQLGATLAEEQGDGLGILSVQPDGDKFTYDAYKSTNPDWMRFHEFVERTKEDTWRYVLHGRFKTQGSVKRENTHPLRVECDHEDCPAEWVVHNGSVRQYQKTRGGLMSAGHTFNTGVDSEIIPHKIGPLPDGELGDMSHNEFDIGGNLHYLVFYENGIFAKLGTKYYVTEDFVVSCSKRKRKAPLKDLDETFHHRDKWFRITPDEDADDGVSIERSEQHYTGTRSRKYNSDSASTTGTSSTSAGSAKTITETYDDLVPDIDEVVAYEVAPGIVKVVDEVRHNHIFVKEDENPQAYEWYVNAERRNQSAAEHTEPDDQEPGDTGIQTLFDKNGNVKSAEELAGTESQAFATHLLEHDDPKIQATAQELVEDAIKEAAGDELHPEDDPLEQLKENGVLNDEIPPEPAEAVEEGDPLGQMSMSDARFRAFMELKDHYMSTTKALNELERMSPQQVQELAAANMKVVEATAG